IKVTHTKSAKDRFVPMNEKAYTELQGIKQKSKNELVFPNEVTGSAFVDIRNGFKAACVEAGIKDFRFHDLRHTFGTRAADAGVPLTAIASVMGHSDIRTTDRYAHATDDGRRGAVEAVEKVQGKKTVVKIWSMKASGGRRG